MGKYEMLYQQIKMDITNGHYAYKQKLPSIREMEKNTGLSRTTIESAYGQLLTEGYIVSRLKSGYFVDVNLKEKMEYTQFKEKNVEPIKTRYRYDFTGTSVDPASFNMELWKKYIRLALANHDSLYEYGQLQGEWPLRFALCRYASMYRGVKCFENQMIIGSGFQSLLTVLCGLFKGIKRVGMPQSGFIHAQMIFNDFNLEVVMLEEDEDGIIIDSLINANVDILYLNTSASGKKARALSISRRLQIVEYTKEKHIYIIEDDHNGELRYSAKPISSMQAQDIEHIIFIGSFSKLMIPSLRIAYMILPNSLLIKYQEKKEYYHQTVSKLEQLALAYYIEDGQLIRQLKKLRRLYLKKSEKMIKAIKTYLPEATIQLEETALRIRVRCPFSFEQNVFLEMGREQNSNFIVVSDKEFVLSYSSIALDDIEEGVQLLAHLLYIK